MMHLFCLYIFPHCEALYWYTESPCEMEQTEAVVPLYLFQVSAHSRPVALQRKPRYSTLAERKGRIYFRDRFRLNTSPDFLLFSLSPLRAGWQQHILRWRFRKAHFLRAVFLILLLFPPSWSAEEEKIINKYINKFLKKDAAYGCCIVKELSLMNQLGS